MTSFSRSRTKLGSLIEPPEIVTLRPGIESPGEYPFNNAVAEVESCWRKQAKDGTIDKATIETYVNYLNSFTRYMTTRGVIQVSDITMELINDWVEAPNVRTGQAVAVNTARNRRTSANLFYQTCIHLGITTMTPYLITREEQRERYVNAFDKKAIKKLKNATIGGDSGKPGAALALALLGLASGEIGVITPNDVNLVEGYVFVHDGPKRHRTRYIQIDDSWILDQLWTRIQILKRQFAGSWEFRPLAYDPNPNKPFSTRARSAATSEALAKIMKTAGVQKPGVTRAASITEYVAQKVFEETGSIEAVAIRLGISKLDDAAHIVGYNWVAKHSFDPNVGGDEL